MSFSRRQFLRGTSGTLGLLAASSTFSRWFGSADAATLSGYAGYRAAICVFLLGGNDGNNVLVPLEDGPYGHYIRARPGIGFLKTALLPINPVGRPAFGLHPALGKLKGHFDQGRAALLCNVGPMVLPMRRDGYEGGVARPDNLFSHSDQQDAWASAIANPTTVDLPEALEGKATGWAGRTADKLHGLNPGEYPEVTSLGGKPLFSMGAERQPLMIPQSGELAFPVTGNASGFDALRAEALGQVAAIHNGVILEASYGGVFDTARQFAEERTTARGEAWNKLSSLQTTLENLFFVGADSSWTLNKQLYHVLRDLIAGAMPSTEDGLGLRRQVFSVGLGGFDTHANQRQTQDALLAQLDFSLDAFHQAMELLRTQGIFGPNPPQATLFTMSDFGRTLKENIEEGTDHGWGNHAIVLGDRVHGQRLYGAFPNLDLESGPLNKDTTDARGRWIPSLTVDQYAFSLASWLGLSTAEERGYVFPNIEDYISAAQGGDFPEYMRAYRVPFMLPDPS